MRGSQSPQEIKTKDTAKQIKQAGHDDHQERVAEQNELTEADLEEVTGGARPGTQTEDDIYIGIK